MIEGMIRLNLLVVLLITILKSGATQNELLITESAGVDRVSEPVTLGVPFSFGQLQDITNLGISLNSNPVDVQRKAMSHWPDGSVRWAKVDFQASIEGGVRSSSYLVNTNSNHITSSSMTVTESSNEIIVNTGVLQFSIHKSSFNLFHFVDLDINENGIFESEERVVQAGISRGIEVVDGLENYSSTFGIPDEIEVEEQGPLKVVIKVAGRHRNATGDYLSYVTRIYAYAQKSFVKIDHSYSNNTSVASLGNLGDPNLGANIDRYGLFVNVDWSDSRQALLGDQTGNVFDIPIDDQAGLVIQQRDRPFTNQPFRFEVLTNNLTVEEGEKNDGWAIFSDDRIAVGVGTKYFWQKYPKGFSIDPNGEIGLHPIIGDNEFLFVGMGASDQHILWFMVEDEISLNRIQLDVMINQPLLVRCAPERYMETDGFYNLSDCSLDEYSNFQSYVDDCTSNHLFNRDDLDLYGNLSFGDVPRSEFEVDDERMFSVWGNNYYDCNLTAARLYALTGEERYFDILEPMALHWMETDCWKTESGDWLNGYCPSYSLNHRENPNFNHHYGEGIWYYYYLTGNERAKEIGLSAAQSINEEQFWANENVFLRGAALRGAACLEAYKITRDNSYLQRVRQQIDAIMNTQNQHGQIGNSFENGTDIQDGQTFMMGLFADLLWKYLQEDLDQGLVDQLILLADFINDYARVPGGNEEYYNFWNSPTEPGVPTPDLTGSPDDFVYWNGKGLVASIYAYAYFFSNDDQYKLYCENLLAHMWGDGYEDAFGFEFFGKASAQALKNVLHAASIVCSSDQTTPASNIDVQSDHINIYPNPTSRYFFITGELSKYSIEILDVQGSVVMTLPNNSSIEHIDLAGLSSGLYFVKAAHLNNQQLEIEIVIKQ